jgi:D-amino-acid dehydrogenase
MRHVIVLGAGVVGVTTAWYLRQEGFEVTVVDRRPLPASETSYANGGQISVSHAEPWAHPGAPRQILAWLLRDDAPLLFRPHLDLAQWEWCLGFLRECLPGRAARNTAANVALGLYSRAALAALTDQLGLEYSRQKRGILQIFTGAEALRRAAQSIGPMRDLGCEVRMVTRGEALAIEPALSRNQLPIVGGTWAEADFSGDAKLFTRALAAKAAAAGVVFRMDGEIERIEAESGRIAGVTIRDAEGGYERLTADDYVLCLGPQSRAMAYGLGLRLPIYPAKGYSITLPIEDESLAPHASITDEAHKIVFSRLGNQLRAAGTAELAGYGKHLNPTRVAAILNRTLEYFPGLGDPAKARAWTGLRPATPSNVPLIGPSRIEKLYLNTGHGTLGWTHACGSARALSSIMAGRGEPISFPFLRDAR